MKKLIVAGVMLAGAVNVMGAMGNDDLEVSVGAGAISKRSIYKTKDKYEGNPLIPLNVSYGDFYLSLMETEAGYTFYNEDGLKLSLIGKAHLGYDSSDLEREYRAMDDRDMDFHLGLKSVYSYENYELISFITGDISGESDGKTAGVQGRAKYQIVEGKLVFTPTIGATYADSGYVDYFYGVKGSEAREGNINNGEEYRGAGSMIYTFNSALTYIYDESVSFSLIGGANLYDSKVANSPIVEKRYEYYGGGSFTYKFR